MTTGRINQVTIQYMTRRIRRLKSHHGPRPNN